MLYSVKMRSAKGGAHELGGKHISGAERIVSQEAIEKSVHAMIERAFQHERGCADFINLKIEQIVPQNIVYIRQLAISTLAADTMLSGRNAAVEKLISSGVTKPAALSGLEQLAGLSESMHGAMLLSSTTGQRLDESGQRGIRVSNMDVADLPAYKMVLRNCGLLDMHVREAVVLASKVQSAAGVMAELCWSDDLTYTTGYVANQSGYYRIPHLKLLNSPNGGRAFFIKPDTNIRALVSYLENTPVLIRPQEKAGCNPCKN